MTTLTALTSRTPTCILAEGSHTSLAVELNAAMEANWGARHLYLCTYGVAWSPLPTPGIDAPVMTLSVATKAGIAPVTNTECLRSLTPMPVAPCDPDDSVRTLVR